MIIKTFYPKGLSEEEKEEHYKSLKKQAYDGKFKDVKFVKGAV